jgi:hypothetical protein
MGIRLLGLTLSGIVEDGGDAQSGANSGHPIVHQEQFSFDNIEK